MSEQPHEHVSDPDPIDALDRQPSQKPTPLEQDPPHPVPDETTNMVHLPGVVADEFGIPRSRVREMIITGKVTVNGEDAGNALDLPYDAVRGQEIAISGGVQSVKFTYRG